MLDFQNARYGPPVIDLINIFISCTGKSLRDKFYNQLFMGFYKSFERHYRKLGGYPEKDYPYDIYKQHLKQFGKYALGISIWGLPFNAGYSLDADKNDEQNNKAFEYYKKRLQDILDDTLKYFS